MLTSELDYHLPQELIAQHPVIPRDRSRLLVFSRGTNETKDRRLPDFLSFLNPGDLVVFNDSRVLKARVLALKPTGGRVELLFLRRRGVKLWEALVKPSARLKVGMGLAILDWEGNACGGPDRGSGPEFPLRLTEHLGEGRWLVENLSQVKTEELLEQVGEMPLPPYIKEKLAEPGRYQTVYATETGSAAAPTAGLHFTQKLISDIKTAGIGMAPLTLHIGLDTFRPVKEADLALHEIHTESYSMPVETYEAILETKLRGGKVVAVGTTAVRALETVFSLPGAGLEGETDLFITPGFKFRAVDALLTNFHLPKSTLLALVMAFAGVEEIRRLYRHAIREKYRFFSFGDAMLVL